jgi:hypothetical protein
LYLEPVPAGRGINSSKSSGGAALRPRNSAETRLKPDWREPAGLSSRRTRTKEIDMRRMIQVGSKEEIELLLALFGSHAQPPKKKPR